MPPPQLAPCSAVPQVSCWPSSVKRSEEKGSDPEHYRQLRGFAPPCLTAIDRPKKNDHRVAHSFSHLDTVGRGGHVGGHYAIGCQGAGYRSQQLAAVNKVQRIVGWREIDLYVMRKGRVDRSGLPALFDDREFVLAKMVTKIGDRRLHTTANCVGGFLFSLESEEEVRSIAFRDDIEVEVLEVDRRFS